MPRTKNSVQPDELRSAVIRFLRSHDGVPVCFDAIAYRFKSYTTTDKLREALNTLQTQGKVFKQHDRFTTSAGHLADMLNTRIWDKHVFDGRSCCED